MSNSTQTHAKAPPAPATAPAHSSLLQRKCACGGAAGLNSVCSECRRSSLTGQISNLTHPTFNLNSPGGNFTQEVGRVAGTEGRNFEPIVQRQIKPSEEEEDEVSQGKFNANEPSARQHNILGGIENSSGMPRRLQSGLEALSGLDLSGVRVHHNSPKPVQLNALAYTQGQEIHLAPGQVRHLTHEGWHVVQQMQKRVKPTMRLNEMSINNDGNLEHEADAMGAKALRMNSTNVRRHYSLYNFTSEQREVKPKNLIQRVPTIPSSVVNVLNNKRQATGEIDKMRESLTKPRKQHSDQALQLPDKDHEKLLDITRGALYSALTAFSVAITEMKVRVKIRLENQKSLAPLFFNIALGILNPGLGRLIGGKLNDIGKKVIESYPRVGEWLKERDPDTIKSIWVNITSPLVKKAVTNSPNESGQSDLNLIPVSGDVETERFLDDMRNNFMDWRSELDTKLDSKSSGELGIIYLSLIQIYPEDYAKLIAELVERYKKQVRPIGEDEDEDTYDIDDTRFIDRKEVVVIFSNDHRRLALVRWPETIDLESWKHTAYNARFLTWISDDMKEAAVAKTKAFSKKSRLSEIHFSKVKDMKFKDILWLGGFRRSAQEAAQLDWPEKQTE